MTSPTHDIDERAKMAGSNKFELLLFRLGESPDTGRREFFGINVFKVREVLRMPEINQLVDGNEHLMGVANIRGQIIPVINLAAVVKCKPVKGLGILMVTEYGRTVQAFAVEEVNEIVRLEWDQVLPAEGSQGGKLLTGLARIDGARPDTRLAQVLDVEQILRNVTPDNMEEITPDVVGPQLRLPPGSVILVADDSAVARTVIEQGLKAMHAPFIMAKTGKEAWDKLRALADQAEREGRSVSDQVALVLTDLEMPEMDGFTLTRLIKEDPRMANLPVVIHSSLTGTTNENLVRSVGADAYVGKFAPRELANTIRKVLHH